MNEKVLERDTKQAIRRLEDLMNVTDDKFMKQLLNILIDYYRGQKESIGFVSK